MNKVTGEQVRAAMIAADITRVEHHECGFCGYMTTYQREGDQLYFDSGCNCSWGGWRPADWSDAADWLNMQSSPKWRDKIAASFGLPVGNTVPRQEGV